MMLLQIYFEVPKEKADDFEKMYIESYVPALRKQKGYIGSKLLKLFPKEVAEEIEAAPTEFNYQMNLIFDTEENRRLWVASEEHQAVWPLAEGMSRSVAWRGFDVVGSDTAS
jgi:heme-degrading monooxygenase HmoA